MPLITLEEAKFHLRVDGADEDADIQLKLTAAEEQAVEYLSRRVYGSQAALDAAAEAGTAGDRPMVINASVKSAVLLIAGHLYRNREDVGDQQYQLPGGARDLLAPFRIQWGV